MFEVRGSRRARLLVVVVVAAALTACSLIVNKDKDQCSVDGDCQPAGASTCMDGVCVLSSTVDSGGGGDGMVNGDGNPMTDGACVPKMPVTQDDFLNEKCTSAQCIPFDNCARAGLCPGVDGGDGGLPALIAPPDGGV